MSEAAGINANRRILVAEDTVLNQIVIAKMLERLGYEYQVVENGAEVLQALQQTGPPFDLILLDCYMPIMDGFSVARKIRELDTPYKNICILAMTALSRQSDKAKCIEAGMNGYLPKPISRSVLEEKLSHVFRETSKGHATVDAL